MTELPRVAVIVLNWNGWRDTIECLESLYGISYSNYEVIVVDNGSTDDSVTRIIEYFDRFIVPHSGSSDNDRRNKSIRVRWYDGQSGELFDDSLFKVGDTHLREEAELQIIRCHSNLGFAEGNNVGIRYAVGYLNPDFILLLNNDTVVDSRFLAELVQAIQQNAEFAFAGPKILFYDHLGRDDVINSAGGLVSMRTGTVRHIGAGEIDIGRHDTLGEVDYIEGSCLLIRTGVLAEIGLLDAAFFLSWEDVDLCRRGAKAGYRSIYVPKSLIWHKVGVSIAKISNTYYITRNMFWFERKNASRTQYAEFLVVFFGSIFYYRLLLLVLMGAGLGSLRGLLRGVIHGIQGSD